MSQEQVLLGALDAQRVNCYMDGWTEGRGKVALRLLDYIQFN